MRNLNTEEFTFVTKVPKILYEEIERPVYNHTKTESEKINDGFVKVSQEINSYSVIKDQKLRNLHKLAYDWSKTESKKDIEDVITSYCPIKMSKADIKLLVDNAVNI